jgi:hypothetical protein
MSGLPDSVAGLICIVLLIVALAAVVAGSRKGS